jgi:ribosomal protein L37AE/L43A
MFDTDLHQEFQCRVCGRRAQNNENMAMIKLDGTLPHANLDQMLHQKFFHRMRTMHCETCRGPQIHRLIRKIWAASQVLELKCISRRRHGMRTRNGLSRERLIELFPKPSIGECDK